MTKTPPAQAAASEKIDRLVDAVLDHIPFDGWTESAFAAGVKQAGLSRGTADLLLPQGIYDVIEQFGARADAAMQTAIEAERGFGRLRSRDKIAFAVQAHLTALAPHREALRRLLVYYALPLNLPLGGKRLYRTVDLIWRAAGDTATDFNFYTKRLLLAAVLKATVLFWLDDESARSVASWAFLDRRLGEVLKLGKSISLLKEFRPGELVDLAKRKFARR